MFRINFYRVSLDFSFRNTKLIVVYVIERITTPIRNVHSQWVLFRFSVTPFLCKLCLLISYSHPEATLKLELHRVQNARSFPNEFDCNQLCDYLFTIDRLFPLIVEMFRINFYRVSLDFSFRNTKVIVVYVIERITTPIRNVH
jgi:hypothetical protein